MAYEAPGPPLADEELEPDDRWPAMADGSEISPADGHGHVANWNPSDLDNIADVGRRAIGAAVRRGRLSFGLSQRQFAWRAGVSQPTVSRIETGSATGIRWPTLARMVGLLYSDRSLTFEGEPPPPTRRLPGQGVEQSTVEIRDI